VDSVSGPAAAGRLLTDLRACQARNRRPWRANRSLADRRLTFSARTRPRPVRPAAPSLIHAARDRAALTDRLVDLGWDRFFENLAERRVRYVMGGEIAALLHDVVTSVCDRAEDFDVDLAPSVTVAVGPIAVAVVPVEDALEAVGHARLVERFRDLTRGETPP
jgi:hypothetical protein